MTDEADQPPMSPSPSAMELDAGGLHFEAEFRAPGGATLRVYGPTAGGPEELLRFDDFVDQPHHHVPAEGDPINLDRAAIGDPLDWYVAQLRDHLGDMLTDAGYAALLPVVDLDPVAAQTGSIRKMMVDCVPGGYVRTPGVGLQRT